MSAHADALVRMARAQGLRLLDYGTTFRDSVQRLRIKQEWQGGQRQQVEKTLRDLLAQPSLISVLAELVEAGTTWLDTRIPDQLWLAVLNAALTAPLTEAPAREAHLRIARAKRSIRQNDLESARKDAFRAEELARAAAVELTQLTAQSLLGEIAARGGEYRVSLVHHQRALDIASRTADAYLRLEAEDNVAVAYAELRENSEAERRHRRVLQEAERDGHIEIALRSSNNLAILFRLQGRTEEALIQHSNQLRLARTHKLRAVEAQALNGLGLVAESRGSHEDALEYFEQALHVRRELDDLHGEAISLLSAGISLKNLGRLTEARAHFALSLERAEQIGDPRACGQALNQLCNAALAEGRLDDASQLAERNLAWARTANNPVAEGTALYTRFLALVGLNDERADETLDEAVRVLRRADFAQGLSNALNAVGRRRLAAHQMEPALEAFEEALELSRRLENPRLVVRDLLCLALCDGALAQPERGLKRLALAAEVLREVPSDPRSTLREQLQELQQALEADCEAAAR